MKISFGYFLSDTLALSNLLHISLTITPPGCKFLKQPTTSYWSLRASPSAVLGLDSVQGWFNGALQEGRQRVSHRKENSRIKSRRSNQWRGEWMSLTGENEQGPKGKKVR